MHMDTSKCMTEGLEFNVISPGRVVCRGLGDRGSLGLEYVSWVEDNHTGEIIWDASLPNLLFQFRHEVPAGVPLGNLASSTGVAGLPGTGGRGTPDSTHILDEDWASNYAQSDHWSGIWAGVTGDGQPWPKGVMLCRGKL